MNLLQLFLGQIPEAIFFGLFMIFAKNLRTRRTLFVIVMIIEYLLLKYSFPYSWLFHIGFMITTFLSLKVIYREKSQITDVFILLVAYIVLGIVSLICFSVFSILYRNMIVATIVNRLALFIPLFSYNYKLYYIQNLYKKYWNRSDKPKIMKSVTFRGLNLVIFNMVFVLLNLGMLFALCFEEVKDYVAMG